MGTKDGYSETAIVRQIIEYLNLQGYVCKRNNAGMIFMNNPSNPRKKHAIKVGEPGFPDIEGIMKDGKYFGIEVKTEKGVATETQQATGDRIMATKGIWFVARSLEDVIAKGF